MPLRCMCISWNPGVSFLKDLGAIPLKYNHQEGWGPMCLNL